MTRHRLNIYVVDNDKAVLESTGSMLLSRGRHAVQTFDSGEAFLADIGPDDFGCVLMDLEMKPGMDGDQVFLELRARGSPLVVLFLSGKGTIAQAMKMRDDGAFGWLEKTYEAHTLFERLDAALERAAAVQRIVSKWRDLSPAEKDVALLVGAGKPNKTIARELDKVDRTVESQRATVYDKLDLGTPSGITTQIEQMRAWGFDLESDALTGQIKRSRTP
jgi:FixJ family two-component response regulator